MFEFWQIALLGLYAFIQPNETAGFKIGMDCPVLAGWFTGLVLGNPETGLFIGGTLQLMTLGVVTYGGMSIPNTVAGAIVGTALSVYMDTELALGIAIPVATFMIQLDVLRRYTCIFLSNRADALINRKEYAKAASMNFWGFVVKGACNAIPILLLLILGATTAQNIMAAVPEWFINALRTSGSLMPVVGIVILMRYLPFKKLWPYMLAGFLLTAYLGVPTLALTLFGVVAAVIDYQIGRRHDNQPAFATVGGEGDEIDE